MKKGFLVLLTLVLVVTLPRLLLAKEAPALFNHAYGDIKYTLFSWPAFIVMGGAFGAAAASQGDVSISKHFANDSKMGTTTDRVFSYIGSPYVVDASAALIFGVGALIKDEKLAFTGENLSEALVFTEAVSGAMKLSFQRDRPNGGTYGFPSAHASRTFCAATVLEILHGPAIGVPAYLTAGLVAFSRMDANVHYLSDLIFGAALGSAIGIGVTNFHLKENKHFVVIPTVGDVKGVQFVYNF